MQNFSLLIIPTFDLTYNSVRYGLRLDFPSSIHLTSFFLAGWLPLIFLSLCSSQLSKDFVWPFQCCLELCSSSYFCLVDFPCPRFSLSSLEKFLYIGPLFQQFTEPLFRLFIYLYLYHFEKSIYHASFVNLYLSSVSGAWDPELICSESQIVHISLKNC